MSVSFKDFLCFAENLLINPDSQEIDYRNVMGRAYYAVYHLAKDKAQDYPDKKNRYGEIPKGSHERLIIKFQKHDNKTLRILGEQMHKLKVNRHRADYDIDEYVDISEAQQLFDLAKLIIEELEKL
ncbi:MAG: hypothetical protein WAX77_05025 [Methylococcaceae bacterium]